MDFLTASDLTHKNGQVTHYYEGGSKSGTPLIFIHGWPDIAESWHHQLKHFSASGKYHVIALDMRGYGGSTAPKDKRAYSLETLTDELVEFAAALGIRKAVWIGHDWGSVVTSALAAHHPSLFLALAVLAVPYHTIQLGLNHLITLVNRDIYPEAEYPIGPWEYMRYYELHSEESAKCFDDNTERFSKVIYMRHDPAQWGKPAPTSRALRDGGWLSDHPERVPDVPLEDTVLSPSLHANLVASHKKHGWFPSFAYYLNHDVNEVFARKEKNGGVLEFPVLFIDAKHDPVCSPSTTPKMGEEQMEKCKDLKVVTIEATHWPMLENPEETNREIEMWLGEKGL
ncbi:hypothetical protein COCVIDRAFT_32174 [Bipolaris victoriae FI3]|uniref:AB hydrolase-1 domain-containing protein n=1 Tax=Bipolaris victoriae (strain FI3) TaxID=930091 RepID=W7DQ89_BIPV3|nr:hypothetical protein COCVIDRAFT_32174 [Bipolaris victoriae FI3]